MRGLLPYTINVGGKLMDLSEPQVMGILNITPDSFYSESRKNTEEEIAGRVNAILAEGGSIIDVGAYSSRPGADNISAEEEKDRLRGALQILRRTAPEAVVSVDTFRADVARMCVEEYGVQIINDISGGQLDPQMFETVAALGVPYVLMHMKGNPQTMQQEPHYDDLLTEMLQYFGSKVQQLHELGVKDIILDPGFGFAKTMDHNYELMNRLQDLSVLELPLLVGVSRKSMIYKLLDSTPEGALNGTSVLNTLALLKGASILRVHDVKAAVEVVQIVKKMLAC
ncbi:MAG: dihydropteroate synthase [Bacteroidaceae bacterium]|jgi:dihydropteroate synthase|nr:dihydropteroate synthase [Bacteroidaceae bacterium]